MFFPVLLSSLLFAQLSPSIPVMAPNPAYPIRVQLLQMSMWIPSPIAAYSNDSATTLDTYLMRVPVKTNTTASFFGHGNILGNNPAGFDYGTDCYQQPDSMLNSYANATYQARWKKQDRELEILLQTDSTHISMCEINVFLRKHPYILFSVGNTTNPLVTPPSVTVTPPNPNYPMHIQLVVAPMLYRSDLNLHYGPYLASVGRGNILGTPEVGFDFSNLCSGNPQLNIYYEPDRFYQARWKKKDKTLEVLLQEFGSDKISSCELTVTLQKHPFDLSLVDPSPAPVRPPSPASPALPAQTPDEATPATLAPQLGVNPSPQCPLNRFDADFTKGKLTPLKSPLPSDPGYGSKHAILLNNVFVEGYLLHFKGPVCPLPLQASAQPLPFHVIATPSGNITQSGKPIQKYNYPTRHWPTGPYRIYRIHYSIAPKDLIFYSEIITSYPDYGELPSVVHTTINLGVLEFTTVLYDKSGSIVNSTDTYTSTLVQISV